MSDIVTITLNDKEVQASAGATILAVAKANGIHIPTFCHDDRLKPYASCFLCVVEVEKARGLLPACSTQVMPGMVIRTDSEKVRKARTMALELMLSDHVGDCVAPCEATCPAHIDIQGYIAHIANGNPEAAVRLIKKSNPLPVVCGRICPHPCESQCRRGLVDEPVSINPLKRFAAEYELQNGAFLPETAPDTGKRVAIVGGGPAGLSAAYYLRQMGHAVVLFEALPELGGMVRYGIPRFRLPWDLLDNEIQAILDLGVDVQTGKKLGEDFTIASLKEDGFDAVLLAIGAHLAKPMRVPNDEAEGVIGGIDFLRKVVLKEPVEVGKKVAVIGGGDTAMDCARVARRLGAEVTLLYRRTQAEMPALPMEQEETMEEGVEFRFLTAPTEVVLDDTGRASLLRVISMKLGDPDESGRRRPVPIEGSEEDLPFDLIISAIGQDPDISCIQKDSEKPETTRWNTFVYDENTNVTTQEGVFAAGDCAFGPNTVIRAVGEGQRAAKAINLYLAGADVELKNEYAISLGRIEELEMEDFAPRYTHKKRVEDTVFPSEERLKDGGWDAINKGLDEMQAMAEASRCIECGCNARFDCDLRKYATEYGADEKRFTGEKRKYNDDTRHPLIKIEGDKCITCGSCVRVCLEVRGIGALSFIDRGFGTRVGPNFDDPLQLTGCDACGMCIDVCPTGALAPNTGKEAGPWVAMETITTCTSCSRGCGLNVGTAEERVVRVTSVDGDPVNNAVICAEGRFGYQLLGGKKSQVDQSSVEEAREILAAAGELAVVISPRLTIEQTYAAARLARSFGGKLFYLLGEDTALETQERGEYGKKTGEANVALLERLQATGLKKGEALSADTVLLVGTEIETTDGKKVIEVNPSKGNADAYFVLSHPLRTEGMMINRDGDLGIVRAVLPKSDHEHDCHMLLVELAGEESLAGLDALRNQLADEIEELSMIRTPEKGERLCKSGLEPVLKSVMPDSREGVFAEHLKAIGMYEHKCQCSCS
ncbi:MULTISPECIES: NAD(P)-binding protein [Prosthecochloris]|uniref:Pyridine nucleotide-disulfide oxidoreductase n=1 Tax=Prosthecochloris marina TaxID=2017681 RepID=A0A317T7H0_9CHLB|nr:MULTISPECIES: NAD(P)-binding protein [Prosthecochloris]PWW82240.1 pyridine nucleotide-disulfide oxidoreductase [Prosthecochloris marina]UZJ37187.1 NAD(P)-binding protein [Prosthecochloris sp. SCSIO W1103]